MKILVVRLGALGDIVHAVKHLRDVNREIRNLTLMSKDERMREAKRLQAPFELVEQVAESGRMPVPNFAAGGVATPADAALCMMLGAEAIFVGSGIFKSDDPERRARPSERLAARAKAAFEKAGLHVAKSEAYGLHPSTLAHASALRHPERTLCFEVRRDLLVETFTPFQEMAATQAKVKRVAAALADALSR